ncbi:hypothetical protein AVEN_52831-1 [Araneus ventricosus]|uniref:Uncharacterized protein n=1 Tax=Araneus ventricosus TaxID=182803 RepID=A0A4Y2A670_ARAVE|nr:hypothetical protein AVEN_52831-1 [Araneus ventricosus]
MLFSSFLDAVSYPLNATPPSLGAGRGIFTRRYLWQIEGRSAGLSFLLRGTEDLWAIRKDSLLNFRGFEGFSFCQEVSFQSKVVCSHSLALECFSSFKARWTSWFVIMAGSFWEDIASELGKVRIFHGRLLLGRHGRWWFIVHSSRSCPFLGSRFEYKST